MDKNSTPDLWIYEKEEKSNGFEIVCGVDEAGRGPLCGPVCAAAVILPYGLEIEGLNDSKKLSEAKREKLFDIICTQAISYGIAFATNEEIDELNILNATFLAMRRAVDMLSPTPQLAFIDGNRIKGIDIPTKCIVKGDAKSANIAAASILAKVTRDRYMLEVDRLYPQYNIKKHKGYPTKEHIEAVRKFGAPKEIYRQSFLKKILFSED
ncbi:MAG: ribonuclease HII [Ruminococcaceae bacterium]|nr:ribonuclease HII [Oscillospiraceae bacterium]